MLVDYTTNTLLTSVKTRAMTADNQNLFTDSDIIRVASEELQTVMIPYVESVKQEFFVNIKDTNFVPTKQTYVMPTRATGNKLRDVSLVDNLGNEIGLPYVPPEKLKTAVGYVPFFFGFFPQDVNIRLLLGNNSSIGNYSLVRMKYFRRPNQLCSTTQAGKIIAIDTNTNEVTLDSAPTTWTTATTFDVINGNPPFQSRGDDQTVTNIAGFVLTFTSLPTDIGVGDWVSEANTSPVIQLPVECHRVLEALTAARLLQYNGDPAWQVFQSQADGAKKDLIQVLAPRVDGAAQKIPVRNPLWP